VTDTKIKEGNGSELDAIQARDSGAELLAAEKRYEDLALNYRRLQITNSHLTEERDEVMKRLFRAVPPDLGEGARSPVEIADSVVEAIKVLSDAAKERDALAKGVKISIPTNTMEQEFQSHYRRGFDAGKRERDSYVGQLKAAVLEGMDAIVSLVGAHGEITAWAEWDACSLFVHNNSALVADAALAKNPAGPPCSVCDATDNEDCAGSRGLCPRGAVLSDPLADPVTEIGNKS
jgi:hypothetical protein